MKDLFQQLSDEELATRTQGAQDVIDKLRREVESREGWLEMAVQERRRRDAVIQAERVKNCQEHYYIANASKWTPIGRRQCMYCGDQLD